PSLVLHERGWGAAELALLAGAACGGTLLGAAALDAGLGRLAWLCLPGLALADLWLSGSPELASCSLAAAAAGFCAAIIRASQRERLLGAASSLAQAALWSGHLATLALLVRAGLPLVLAAWQERLGVRGELELLAVGLASAGFALQLAQALAFRF